MNPIPSENPKPADAPQPDESATSVADTFALTGRRHAPANRRANTRPAQWVYPALLIASTLVAAIFCLLYITKPVVVTSPDGVVRTPVVEAKPALARNSEVVAEAEPDAPIEPAPAREKPAPASAAHDGHEETNLRVQHVLNASAPDGDLSRIVLDVPVLYGSRNLRWTEVEVARAREIHARLADYHEQSRDLRELGTGILTEWNELIERSIPAAELRADSPSLPANQEDAAHLPRPAVLDTTESIEIRPSGP